MTAADKPRMVTPCANPACGHVDDSEHPCGHICPQPRSDDRRGGDGVGDKPRADLVALLLLFESCAAGMSSLYLSTADAGPAVATWVEMRGHSMQVEQLARTREGKLIAWTHWTVTSSTGQGWTVTCSLHDDHEVTEPAAQADQQVLARVKEALDRPRTGPQDFECTACGATMQSYDEYNEYQHEGCGGLVERKEQPEAAEGSV